MTKKSRQKPKILRTKRVFGQERRQSRRQLAEQYHFGKAAAAKINEALTHKEDKLSMINLKRPRKEPFHNVNEIL